jgi:hypothetical protein
MTEEKVVKAEKKRETESDIARKARRLLADPAFLFKVGQKIEELGVVGEERNRLILFLACVTRVLPNPAAIIIRGSSGKSSLVNPVIWLFDGRHVVDILDLSEQEIRWRLGRLSEHILLIDDYRDSAKDKQILMKLLQPQGAMYKAFQWGKDDDERDGPGDKIYIRQWPVVLFTTRGDAALKNEESRFLSLHTDETPAQSLAIVKARALGLKLVAYDKDLELWESNGETSRTIQVGSALWPNSFPSNR